jgi:hypothetical protein
MSKTGKYDMQLTNLISVNILTNKSTIQNPPNFPTTDRYQIKLTKAMPVNVFT